MLPVLHPTLTVSQVPLLITGKQLGFNVGEVNMTCSSPYIYAPAGDVVTGNHKITSLMLSIVGEQE